jgi:SAM-dependent methyltransferase
VPRLAVGDDELIAAPAHRQHGTVRLEVASMAEFVNAEMVAAWDGDQGDQWVETEEQMNRSLAAHAARLLEAASVGTSEHVVDIGCGTGETTRACAERAVDGRVVGIDVSTAMLERARLRAAEAGLTNVEFERGDAQVYPFAPASYDVVVSRFGVMFFDDPLAAFTNIGRSVKPGGRLACVVWQDMARNEWVTVAREALAVGRALPVPPPGAPGPFGLADPDRTRGILEAAGFSKVELEDVAVPFSFGTDLDGAFDFAQQIGIMRGLLDDLDGDQRARALDALRAAIVAHDTSEGVVFDSRVWMITGVR